MLDLNSIEEVECRVSDPRTISNSDRATTELKKLDQNHHREDIEIHSSFNTNDEHYYLRHSSIFHI